MLKYNLCVIYNVKCTIRSINLIKCVFILFMYIVEWLRYYTISK